MITLYSKPDCKLCTQSKDLLSARNFIFNTVTIGVEISREELVQRFPEAKTLPIIVLTTGEIIFGLKDLQNYMNSIPQNYMNSIPPTGNNDNENSLDKDDYQGKKEVITT